MTAPLVDAGRKLHARVRRFFDAAPDASASPLELLQAALDRLEALVQPAGRGSRLFPYNRVVVHIAQPAPDRAAIEAVFAQLPARLRERLGELRCEMPATLVTTVAVAESAAPGQEVLRLQCTKEENGAPRDSPDKEPPGLRVCAVKGQCEQADYAFQGGVTIGRGGEPADAFGRVRRNQVAFLEVQDGVTETVARAHARIEFDPAARAYVLFNETRTNPTSVLRGGRSLRVVPLDPRGVRLQTGDEITLGRAVLKVSITGHSDLQQTKIKQEA